MRIFWRAPVFSNWKEAEEKTKIWATYADGRCQSTQSSRSKRVLSAWRPVGQSAGPRRGRIIGLDVDVVKLFSIFWLMAKFEDDELLWFANHSALAQGIFLFCHHPLRMMTRLSDPLRPVHPHRKRQMPWLLAIVIGSCWAVESTISLPLLLLLLLSSWISGWCCARKRSLIDDTIPKPAYHTLAHGLTSSQAPKSRKMEGNKKKKSVQGKRNHPKTSRKMWNLAKTFGPRLAPPLLFASYPGDGQSESPSIIHHWCCSLYDWMDSRSSFFAFFITGYRPIFFLSLLLLLLRCWRGWSMGILLIWFAWLRLACLFHPSILWSLSPFIHFLRGSFVYQTVGWCWRVGWNSKRVA